MEKLTTSIPPSYFPIFLWWYFVSSKQFLYVVVDSIVSIHTKYIEEIKYYFWNHGTNSYTITGLYIYIYVCTCLKLH